MGSRSAPLAALSLLGVLATSCLGASRWEDAELRVELSGSESPCQGQLKVLVDGAWHTVDNRSWDQHHDPWERLNETSKLCQKLGCGRALALSPLLPFRQRQQQLICPGRVGTFLNCSNSSLVPADPLSLICLEPRKTPPPTSPAPRVTVAPTAPPRLRLVAAPGGLRCAGVLEVHMAGEGGSVCWTPGSAQALGALVCQTLSCGSFVRLLAGGQAGPQGLLGELPPRWAAAPTNTCAFPESCFLPARPLDSGARPHALLCSGFQPKVQSRLVGGSGPCSGSVEVRQDGPWAALCGSAAQPRERWEEVCQEQRCGQLSSFHLLDQRTTRGQRCPQERLSQCHLLQEEPGRCKRVFVTCQDPNPAGLGAGSVASIVLALVLLAMLLAVCGPLAYKTLVKKFRQRKQRQWIGPTEMSQSMSFHRNHTVRPPADSPAGPHMENEYGPAPHSAQAAYPALEGVLHRVSAQPEYSSDSDYDLQGAQRL